MRDGVIRLNYETKSSSQQGGNAVTGDTLPIKPYVFITCSIVFVAAMLGAVCTQIEVVLAYKGGIFGSLMVYILPPLMRTAISEQTLASLKYGVLPNGPSSSSISSSSSRTHASTGIVAGSEVSSPLQCSGEEEDGGGNDYVHGGGNNKYLHVSQQDNTSVHSNFTNSSSTHSSLKQPENDIILNNHSISSLYSSHDQSQNKETMKLRGSPSPETLVDIIKVMYSNPVHWKCAFIFTWGVGSGLLSVGITILKQAGVLSS